MKKTHKRKRQILAGDQFKSNGTAQKERQVRRGDDKKNWKEKKEEFQGWAGEITKLPRQVIKEPQ